MRRTIHQSLATKVWQSLLMAAALGLFLLVLPCARAYAQAAAKPLSKERVVALLKGDVSPSRVADLARERGIDFQLTSRVEEEVRQAGGDDALLAVLRELAPKPTAPAQKPLTVGLPIKLGDTVDQAKPADQLIEAATYLARAEEQEKCSVEEARKWTKQALETAKKFRGSSSVERDTAGNFIAKCNLKLAALDQREENLRLSEKAIRKAIKQKRLETAQADFNAADPPTCDAGFQNLAAEIKAGRDTAGNEISTADSLVQQDPKQALSHYDRALQSDVEYPELREKMQHAADLQREQKRK